MMRLLLPLALSLLLSPPPTAAVKYDSVDDWEGATWTRRSRAHDEMVTFRVNLAQSNLDKLDELFWSVSTPGNEKYGKFFSKAFVQNLVSPPEHVREMVRDYFMGGYDGSDSYLKPRVHDYGDYLQVSMVAWMVMKRLDADLWVVDDLTYQQHVGHDLGAHKAVKIVGGYSLPQHIARHVDFIDGICGMPKKVKHVAYINDLKTAPPSQDMVIPLTIRNLYAIGDYTITTNSSQGVGEFSDDNAFLQSDMDGFVKGVGINPPNKIKIYGPYNPNPPDGEATLDIQYITAIGNNGTNFYQTVKDSWLLGFAQDLMNMESPPLVNSMSWATDERQEGQAYNNRCNMEYKKLGLRGVSMLASSGDNGAVGGPCSGNQYTFNPGFPGASSYVVSVGATMLVNVSETTTKAPVCSGGSYTCAASGKEDPADEPSGGYATGGGFSVFEPRPSWQAAEVEAYMANTDIPKPPNNTFNPNHRGFPDVAANGNFILIYISGGWQVTGGTSASAPIWGGILAILNDHRMKRNQSPLGFANPLLYKMAKECSDCFLSIGNLHTNNKDGCAEGYVSNPKGWDPVTGLGTPNVKAMLAYLSNL